MNDGLKNEKEDRSMLSKPVYGWSDFQLDGTSVYALSYLTDIAMNWLDQAIHGLETRMPFCVKGNLEPNRFLCIVSYWNCYILCEDIDRYPLNKEKISYELSHTSMLQFCKILYQDIYQNLSEWISFLDNEDDDLENRKKVLCQKLKDLHELISQREEDFGEHRFFF